MISAPAVEGSWRIESSHPSAGIEGEDARTSVDREAPIHEAGSMSDATFLKSNFYEQLVEHVFISEILQEVWFAFGHTTEVLRSEVDSSGYDIVLECNDVVRHVQLKTSKSDAKRASQNVNIAIARKPSGCIVWLVRAGPDDRSYAASLLVLWGRTRATTSLARRLPCWKTHERRFHRQEEGTLVDPPCSQEPL